MAPLKVSACVAPATPNLRRRKSCSGTPETKSAADAAAPLISKERCKQFSKFKCQKGHPCHGNDQSQGYAGDEDNIAHGSTPSVPRRPGLQCNKIPGTLLPLLLITQTTRGEHRSPVGPPVTLIPDRGGVARPAHDSSAS